jgi:hypothetical protein
MNPRGGKPPEAIERENALLDFANRQAQEAILNPNLPGSYKDEVVDAAIGTIQKVAERKVAYYAKYGEGRRLRQFHVIYEAPKEEGEEQEETRPIIAQLNENLKRDVPQGGKTFTVEWIAERAGIHKNILYEWAGNDSEFTTALERLKVAQENDPFTNGTEEDVFVNSMMIALLLLETRDRVHKSQNS